MSDTSPRTQVLNLMAQIVSAHVAHNAVRADALAELIQSVYATLASVGVTPAPVEKQQPAVPVKRSVFADHIVCLEDGKKLKMLKRHLQTSFGMTPEQYRERWGLPPDYPMVAPNYAERRSDLAKRIGLGRKRAETGIETDTPSPPIVAPVVRMNRGSKGARRPRQRRERTSGALDFTVHRWSGDCRQSHDLVALPGLEPGRP